MNHRLARSFGKLLCISMWLLGISAAHAIPIQVAVTADNVYGIYTGTQTAAGVFVGADNDWPTAETYNFNLPASEYIYVVSYTDDFVAQGFLAQFTNQDTGFVFYSSDPQWQVTATGINKGTPDPQPTLAELTAQIVLANAGTNPSGGWVNTTVGPPNGALPWGPIAGIDPQAKWSWYDSGLDPDPGAPFSGFNHNEYLIFRIAVNAAPIPEPGSLWLLLIAGMGMLIVHRRRRA